jgi:hypothetical protein
MAIGGFLRLGFVIHPVDADNPEPVQDDQDRSQDQALPSDLTDDGWELLESGCHSC